MAKDYGIPLDVWFMKKDDSFITNRTSFKDTIMVVNGIKYYPMKIENKENENKAMRRIRKLLK